MTSPRDSRRDAATHSTASAIVRDLLINGEAGDPLTILRHGSLRHVRTDRERSAFYAEVAGILGWHAVGGLLNGSDMKTALAKVDLVDHDKKTQFAAAELAPILERQRMIDGEHGVID